MADTANVKGLDALQKMLDTLAPNIEKKIMRGAMRAGAKPVQQEIKANVAVATGEYRDGIKISTSSKGGRVTANIKATGKHAFLGPWLEFGVAAHKIAPKVAEDLAFGGVVRGTVDHPGIKPRPAFRPALDSQASAALVATGEYVKTRLTKEGLAGADEVDLEPQ